MSAVGNPVLYLALGAAFVATYTPILWGLITEYRRLYPVSRARPLRAAGAVRSRVGRRNTPNASAVDTGSAGRHRAPEVTPRRVMPPAGTWRVAVPAGGPATKHGRPVCG